MNNLPKEKIRVLLMCLRNDARSPMAEAWMNHLFGDHFEARSAGLEPLPLNPLAVQVMKEVGIQISGHSSQMIFNLVLSGELFSYAITLWDQTAQERRPFFPGLCIRFQWDIPDPAMSGLSLDHQLAKYRKIRDDLKRQIEIWADQVKSEPLFFAENPQRNS